MFRFIIAIGLSAVSHLSVAQRHDSDHAIAPELVGKWCYISSTATSSEQLSASCLTLNRDGTYEMEFDKATVVGLSPFPAGRNSDAGQWWVSGNIFGYKSDSQGEGSFRFQKTMHPVMRDVPVIEVSGAMFAPGSPREPWE